jgi:cardiolipin synthase
MVCMQACAWLGPLPDAQLDRTRPLDRRAAPLRLVGPDGRVPRATRERITRRLAEIGEDNLLARHLAAMEEVSPAPLVAGNEVGLLVDGPQTYAAVFEAIERARDHVNLETYIFDDARHRGTRLTDLLVAAASRRVTVNLLYDALGSMGTDAAIFERLRAAGVQLCAFNPLNPADSRTGRYAQRTHRKIVVVDGRVAFSGGLNFSGEYASSSSAIIRRGRPTIEDGWRDTHVQVEGPAVQEIQKLFLASWAKQRCPELTPAGYLPPARDAGDKLLRLDASSIDDRPGETYVAALAAVSFARRSIDVTMAYFAPDDRLQEALVDAARRGVRVRMLLPGISDFTGILHAGRAHYGPLLEAGIEIHEEPRAFVHAKTLVVDGIWSTVGSANWDYRSFADNDELNVVVIDAEFAARMTALFERDLAPARRITLEAWRARPLWRRSVEGFWRLWERLL